ncbi:MAG: M18 family aminopeptidase [Epulopiscium sp.]|nr:M18 family aminopeptidase [Candidatus Epulonipiscium sp.]
MDNTLAKELISFIDNSPSPFHVVDNIKRTLKDNGFISLDTRNRWEIQKNGRYFVTTNDSAIVAFDVGEGSVEEQGFKIIAAHTDSPTFRIKPTPEMRVKNYIKLNTESYGGPILHTWLDRPLSVAGRVVLKSNNIFKPVVKLVDLKDPIVIIPSLAIHMNRKVNEGIQINKQKDTLPLLGIVKEDLEKNNRIVNLLSHELENDTKEIIDFDLFLYTVEKGTIMGMNREFISSPKLDDLAMVHGGLKAIVHTKPKSGINVLVCFDNEEVGSATRQGADSPMLYNILERILISLGKDRADYFRALAHSYMISADMAHALHPNYEEKQDPTHHPLINGGPVIKISANQKYTSDAITSSIYEQICKEAGVPVQRFVNRSDEAGGSTIGPIISTQLGIQSVDIGSPMLSMHSIRELGGVLDHEYIIRSFERFYCS